MIREHKADRRAERWCKGQNIHYDLFLWVHLNTQNSKRLLPVMACVYPLFLSTPRLIAHSFYLVLPLFYSQLPLSLLHPPLSFSWGIACLPGGVAEELVRLSSEGFHLVILPLSIHTTLLPPEAACLHTDLLKETSHCHFNFQSIARFSAPIPSLSLHPFRFSSCLFFANSLLCGLSFFLSPSPCVSSIFSFASSSWVLW